MIRGIVGVGPGKVLGMDSFSGVLGVVLNATVVAFGNMACGKAIYLAETACILQFLVIGIFDQYKFEFLLMVFSFWCRRWKLVLLFWGIGS